MTQAVDEHEPRVLIVDDLTDNRRLVAACLRNDSLVIDEAGDGRRALQLVYERRPQVVILDMDLPLLDGFSTLRMIRSAGFKNDEVRIIALTARLEADADLYRTAGADDYLAKPVVEPSLLRAKVRAQLRDLARTRFFRNAIAMPSETGLRTPNTL